MSESDTMFNERHRRCAAVQLTLSTDPSYNNRTIASTLKMQIWIATNNRHMTRVMKTKFPATVMVFVVVSSEGHIMPLHIFEVGSKVHTNVYLNVMKSVVPPWCNQVAGGRLWVWLHDSGLASEEMLRLCTLLSLAPILFRREPAGILRFVIRLEHHQHDLPQHQSQLDRRHLLNICRDPADACEKGVLPIPDPYRIVYWGWRRERWIDASSTT